MSEQIKENLAEKDHWIRLLLAVFFALVFTVTASLLGLMTLVQYGILLLTGSKNQDLVDFCAKVIGYQTHVANFATLNTNDKPFPFGPWPGEEKSEEPAATTESRVEPEVEGPASEPA